MLKEPTLRACETLIADLTGEKLKRGGTGWLEVIARALLMGSTYKSMWEDKHGEIQSEPTPGDDAAPSD